MKMKCKAVSQLGLNKVTYLGATSVEEEVEGLWYNDIYREMCVCLWIKQERPCQSPIRQYAVLMHCMRPLLHAHGGYFVKLTFIKQTLCPLSLCATSSVLAAKP